MTGTFHRFLADNAIIVSSVGAQAFFMLGLALAVQYWRHSHVALARHLKWLAAFGLLLAFHEWGDVFIPLQEPYLAQPIINILRLLQAALLAAAFACLFQFAVAALEPLPAVWRWLRLGPAVGFALWLAVALGPLMEAHTGIEGWHMEAMVWARYGLALPAALLAAYALRHHTRRLTAPMEMPHIARWLRIAAWALLGLAFFAGLVVPRMPWFPANTLNEDTVQQVLVLPPVAFRAMLGLVLALAFIRALGLFRAELDRQLGDLQEAQTLSQERERLSRELHDGALQSIYAAGLLLRTLQGPAGDREAAAPQDERIAQSMELLDAAVADLRGQIGALQSLPTGLDLSLGLENLIAQRHLRSLVEVDLDVDLADGPAPAPRRVAHVLAVANEALSNVVRHTNATRVTVQARQADDFLCLEVTDNGGGIPDDAKAGSGLSTMRERARLLGGSLAVQSHEGVGTTVLLKVPWPEGEKADARIDC
jgi:signal transduction histidine kinase